METNPKVALLAALFLLVPPGALTAAPSLAEVGDLGKVVDSQGIASVRPKLADRWSAAAKNLPVKPGDWLRTDVRGANALAVRLRGGGQVILGPGSLVEAIDIRTIGLIRGEIEVSAAQDGGIEVRPAEGKGLQVRDGGRKVLRRPDGRGLEALEKDPNWLLGFKGAIPSESMGSLLAKVDGRNTPLTLGYHKVNVDIRDGIARTVIEESFANHTDSRLEGTFYFPLPQDASISGFGMWIGGELIEADVVEKQRAREIYETILRERRDPGLLEWTGGNLFKARVFPIEAHSEKRIKITYTQVLPMRHGKLRYSYGMQSEMLRQHPLRELAIDLRVSSALPIRAFACTTHDARISQTEHAARAEFTAQEYTPWRDFEVEIDVDAAASPVVMIPHQRGEDGYFLALVTPPGGEGEWQRELIPDGPPIHLVILADTSGSMHAAARANQDALAAALLGALGPNDSFDMATCDTELRWLPAGRGEETPEARVARARQFLAARNSLGWTDLDQALQAVFAHVGRPNSHVVYIGDGVPTRGDADPAAFANRLKRLYAERKASLTCHAVAPGSSYDSGVLKAIASLGGGSLRKVSGSDTAATVANDLLAGIARPGMRGMRLEFQGLRVARVYPADLPNLPAGSQQVVLGRYLPERGDQAGEIAITGTLDGREVRYRAPFTLKDAGQGNSFIPRLWARMHLDALLEQGRTQQLQDQIIALSEEYKIMTPYTSFLVLESDADRERFKVKKRFQMRDGELFFAEGRNQAHYELLQQQMRLAGTWRLNLQRGILRELGGLGRMTPVQPVQPQVWHSLGGMAWGSGSGVPGRTDPFTRSIGGRLNLEAGSRLFYAAGDKLGEDLGDFQTWDESGAAPAVSEPQSPSDGPAMEFAERESLKDRDQKPDGWELDDSAFDARLEAKKELAFEAEGNLGGYFYPTESLPSPASGPVSSISTRPIVGFASYSYRGRTADEARYKIDSGLGDWYWRDSMGDLVSLFPTPPDGGRRLPERGAQPHPWPAEALALADSLLRLEALASIHKGGIAISEQTEAFDVKRGVPAAKSSIEALLSANSWCVASDGDRQGGDVQWWQDNGTRGRCFEALGLGRECPAQRERDRFAFPLGLGDHSLDPLAETMRQMNAAIGKREGDRAELVLTDPNNPRSGQSHLIDTARHVLLQATYRNDGKVTGTVEFSDFVEVAGCWWARMVEHKNADGKTVTQTRRTVEPRNQEAFAKALEQALGRRGEIIFIHGDLPAVETAKQAEADGKPSFESEFALCSHFALSQQWERASGHFEAMRRFQGGKRGMTFLDIRFLEMKRRNEEARAMIFETARALAANQGAHELFLAAHLESEAQRVTNPNERLDFLNLVRPIHERAAARLLAGKDWRERMAQALESINRRPEAHEMLGQLAGDFPWDANLQARFANSLANQGDTDAAVALLDKLLARRGDWLPGEINSFRSTLANLLENRNRVADVLAAVTRWLDEDGIDQPESAWVRGRYLSALIRTGEDEKAYDLMEQWLADAARLKGEAFDAAARNRAGAALDTLFGSSYGVYRDDIPERFHQPLAALVRRFALDAKDFHYAERPMQDHRFVRTEAARALRGHFAQVLAKRAAKLDLAALNRLYNWTACNDPAVDKKVWTVIAETLIGRWSRLEKRPERDGFAAVIARLASGQLGAGPYLGFLRRQLDQAPQEDRGRHARQLFDAVLAQSHTRDLQEEAFSLLDQIDTVGAVPAEQRRNALIAERADALIRLDDWVLKSGLQVGWDRIENKEDLPRTELAAKREELVRSVREALSARLSAELEKRRGTDLADWLSIERLFVDVALKRDAGPIAAECWEYLGSRNLHAPPEKDGRPWHETVLIERHVTTLEFLATRPQADPALAERLLEWLERGIAEAAEPEPWKEHQYRLLVALDRPQPLRQALDSWIKPADADNRWRVALGYLHAELNEIPRAIAQFEAVEKADELGPREYRTLADWYLVQDRKPDRDRAVLGFYRAMQEWQLANLIQQHTNRIERGFNNGTPEDFDPAVVDMFKAIFKKSGNPQNHLYQLGSLFRYTKDFRLLECVPEGILGNSAQQIYPFLGAMNSVLQYVGDEATTDRILAHLGTVRERATTTVDRRGLDLLEMLARRKAAEVLNQPGQHVPAALAAMQRAFKGDWGTGERRLMADFLAGLGNIARQPLANEQLHELQSLFRAEQDATPDHLHIALRWAETLRAYGDPHAAKAVDILESTLDGFIAAHGHVLTTDAQEAFDRLVGWFESDNVFARGERKILDALGQAVTGAVHDWLVERKFRLYMNAISSTTGRFSLGEGIELYRNTTRDLIAALATTRTDHRFRLCQQLIDIYRAAHFNAKTGQAKDDVVAFGQGAFDEMVGFDTQNYQDLVQQLAATIRDLAGDLPALAFLIRRHEREPEWLRATGNGGWQRHGHQLAEYRSRAKDIGDLAPRLLKIALAELRRDLERQRSFNQSIYHIHSGWFWNEKRGDFLQLAQTVARERRKSIIALKYIAGYLFNGLDANQEAIDILVDAHRRGIQDEGGISQLADFLERCNRHAEAVPYLREIVAMNASQADYRRRMITSLALSGDRGGAIAALDAAISHFKEHKNWSEQVLSLLAQACHDGRIWERGVELYAELIPLHQRTQPNRGIGNGTLSRYYTLLSGCHSQLGHTAEAVEAAAGAIVSWGPNHDRRAEALAALKRVLAEAPNLPGYVERLDKSVAECGLENPIVRKALGEVLLERKQYRDALRHLRLAAETQPDDAETQQKLIEAHDALGDGEGAVRQLLAAIELSPRSLTLLKDLGDRYEKLGNADEAERARTNLVEALPNESEGHATLAAIRESQNRWQDAAAHWAMVAEIRALEPAGLQGLAKARLNFGDFKGARASLEALLAKEWPSRFGDVHGEARRCLAAVEQAEGQGK